MTGEAERAVPDEVVKAVREAMRETMDSSIFGNSHDEPAEREYDMAEHVATAAQAELRKEWDEERAYLQAEADEMLRSRDRMFSHMKTAEAARARDAEALTTATERLRYLSDEILHADRIAAYNPSTRRRALLECDRVVLAILAAIDYSPQPTTAKRLATATEALKAIAAPEHQMPDDWAAMVAQNALDAIDRKES